MELNHVNRHEYEALLLIPRHTATAGDSLEFFCQCLEKFLHCCRCSSKAGLASSHVAIIADSTIQSYLLQVGVFHKGDGEGNI